MSLQNSQENGYIKSLYDWAVGLEAANLITKETPVKMFFLSSFFQVRIRCD